MNVTKRDTYMMKQIQKKNSISSNNGYNSQNIEYEVASIHHKKIDSNSTSQKPCITDRVKLMYIDDEYAGLTQDICGTITGISNIKELFRRDNRPESIIWVEWDNGIKLGLIEGVDKYEIISDTKAEQRVILQDSKDQGSN
jgi:hypothetical protein